MKTRSEIQQEYDKIAAELTAATGGCDPTRALDDLSVEALAAVGCLPLAWTRERVHRLAVLNRALQLAPERKEIK
jgi:hypothetical protein